MNLNRQQVQNIVEQMKREVVRPECWTCDCFQGLLTQLELDCAEDITDLTTPVKAPKEKMHGCLGCDPCPNGAMYASYLRGQLNPNPCSCQEGNHTMNTGSQEEKIRQSVRQGYAEIAATGSGCYGSGAPKTFAEQIGYTSDELNALPEGANMGLSCGNPTAIANLKPGQVVLDLGSGAGFDVFIAARKVGPTGKSIGVDMTPQMLDKARNSIAVFTQKTGLSNVEFRLGEIEHLPVADHSIDVIISNCVINLSADKSQVWRQISRALKPGGKACVSDLALKKPFPQNIRDMVVALVGCVAGAVTIDDTVRMAKEAGLTNIQYTEKEYAVDVMENCNDKLYQSVKDALPKGEKLSDYVVSVNFIAEKPVVLMTTKQKELIAISASVTAHCQSCLIWHLDKARQAGASEKEIDMAVSIGKAVQKGSVAAMESFINEQQGRCVSPHQSICTSKDAKEEQSSGHGQSSCGCK